MGYITDGRGVNFIQPLKSRFSFVQRFTHLKCTQCTTAHWDATPKHFPHRNYFPSAILSLSVYLSVFCLHLYSYLSVCLLTCLYLSVCIFPFSNSLSLSKLINCVKSVYIQIQSDIRHRHNCPNWGSGENCRFGNWALGPVPAYLHSDSPPAVENTLSLTSSFSHLLVEKNVFVLVGETWKVSWFC